jgi:hypothetical protein
MKTVEDLRDEIAQIPWFQRLGEPLEEPGIATLANLEPWANAANAADADEDRATHALADAMDWLPTTRDQEDPIHGRSLEEKAKALVREEDLRRESLDIYKRTLASLRGMKPHPLLKVGPHDFSPAAKGAATFAARRAVGELTVEEPGFWCLVMSFYIRGHWPCGILPDKTIVVL